MAEKKVAHNDVCKLNHFHNDAVDAAIKLIPEDEDIIELSDAFKVLSDMSRLKIVFALLNRELCVCDIVHVVNMSQSAISHQLRVLRSAHIVKYRKSGKLVYYSIDDEHVESIIKIAFEHLKEHDEK